MRPIAAAAVLCALLSIGAGQVYPTSTSRVAGGILNVFWDLYAPYSNLWVFSPDYNPTPRQSAVTWRDTRDPNLIFMFGGYDNSVNDINYDQWVYNMSSNLWACVRPGKVLSNGADGAVVGAYGVPAKTNSPGARYIGGVVTSLAQPGHAYLWGGSLLGSSQYGDQWEYDSGNDTWTFWGGTGAGHSIGATSPTVPTPSVYSTANNFGSIRAYAYWRAQDGSIWMLGGDTTTGSDYRPQAWVFLPGANPSEPNPYQWKQAKTWTCSPYALEASWVTQFTDGACIGGIRYPTAVVDNVNPDYVWIYGGQRYDHTNPYATNLNLWRYTMSTGAAANFYSAVNTPPYLSGDIWKTAGKWSGGAIGWRNGRTGMVSISAEYAPNIIYFCGGLDGDGANSQYRSNTLWALVTSATDAKWIWVGGSSFLASETASPTLDGPVGGPFAAANVPPSRAEGVLLADSASPFTITSADGALTQLSNVVVQHSLLYVQWIQQPTSARAGDVITPAPSLSVQLVPYEYTLPINNLTATLMVVNAPGSFSYTAAQTTVVNGVATFNGFTIHGSGEGLQLWVVLGESWAAPHDVRSDAFNITCHPTCETCVGYGSAYGSQCLVCDEANGNYLDATGMHCTLGCGGSFVSGSVGHLQCQNCSTGCAACHSAGLSFPSQCQMCDQSAGYVLTPSNVCGSTCPAGTYPDRTGTVHDCTTCAFGCVACTGATLSQTDCQTCNEPSFVRDMSGACVTSCPSGQYRDFSQTPARCSLCATGCAACSSGTGCSACDEAAGYVRSRAGECTTTCAAGEYADLQANPHACAVCGGACATCSNASAVCDTCSADAGYARDLLTNTCVKPCPVGFNVSTDGDNVCSPIVCAPPLDRNGTLCPPEADFGATCLLNCLDGSIGSPTMSTCGQPTLNGPGVYLNTPNCVTCVSGSYARSGDVQCQKCVFGTTARQGASEISECLCSEGYYEADPLTPGVCSPCIDGAVCPGGHQRPYSAEGFYESGTAFIACAPSLACTGNNTCGTGYDGYLCGDCIKGFYHIDRQCESCNSATELKVALGVVMASAACLFLITVAIPLEYGHDGYAFASPALALSFIQITATFLQIHLYWPDQLLQLLIVFSALNLNIDIISPECLVTFSFYDKMKVELLVPIAVFGLFLLVFVGRNAYVWVRSKDRDAAWRGSLDAFWTFSAGFLLFLCLAYTFLAQTSLQLFACVERPDGKITLAVSQTTPCYDATWYSNLPLALVGVGLYIVVIPIVLIVVYRHLARTHGHLVARAHPLMNFAIAKYRPKYWYFEVVTIIRKLLLVGISTFLVRDPVTSALLCGIVLIFTLLMSVALRPFVWDKHDIADTASSLGSLLVLLIGVLATTSTISDAIRQLLGTIAIGVAGLVGLVLLGTFVLEIMVRYRVFNLERRENSLMSKWDTVDPTKPIVGIVRVGESLVVANDTSLIEWPAVTVTGFERTPTQVVALQDGALSVGICVVGRMNQVLVITRESGVLLYDRALTSCIATPAPLEVGPVICWAQAPRFVVTAHGTFENNDEGDNEVAATGHMVLWPIAIDTPRGGIATVGVPLATSLPHAARHICAVNDEVFFCTDQGEIWRATFKPDQRGPLQPTVVLRMRRRTKISGLAATPKVLLLASGFVVQGLSLATGEVVMNLPGHRGDACHVSVAGGRIFTGTWTGVVRVWDSTDGSFIERNLTQKYAVRQLHAHGDMVYTADAKAAINGWKLMGARAAVHLDPIHAWMQKRRANYRVAPGPSLVELVGVRRVEDDTGDLFNVQIARPASDYYSMVDHEFTDLHGDSAIMATTASRGNNALHDDDDDVEVVNGVGAEDDSGWLDTALTEVTSTTPTPAPSTPATTPLELFGAVSAPTLQSPPRNTPRTAPASPLVSGRKVNRSLSKNKQTL